MTSGFNWIPRFAINRPVTIFMALAAIVLLGVVSYFKLAVELMPSGGRSTRVWLQASYPQATAADILESILEPVEEGMRTLPRLESIRSRATAERASLSLAFHRGTDPNEAYLNIREKLERLRPELPEDFDRFTVWRWDDRSRPIFWARVAVRSAERGTAGLVLDAVEAALLRIPGVAKVDLWGRSDQEVAVLVDREAAEALRADAFWVVDALRDNNFALPLGTLEGDARQQRVRAVSRFDAVERIAELPLRQAGRLGLLVGSRAGSGGLRVGDLARVELRESERESWSKMDGRPVVMLAIYKEDAANTIAVGRAVRETLAEGFPKDPLLSEADVQILFGEDLVIAGSVSNLQQTALWGGLFALVILLAFLRRLVPTLLIMTAVPLSILMTLIGMYFLEVSINLITMTGLMLALGMLVDNSVVVVENIARLRARGWEAREAAVRGAGEVGMAIVMGTLTTIIVFVPLPFLGTRAFLSFIFGHLSLPITLSLVSSLFVAALFVPLAASRLLGPALTSEPRWFSPVREGYRDLLRWVLRRPLDASLLLLALLATAWLPAAQIKFDLFGSNSLRRVQLGFQFSPVHGVEEIEAYFDQVLAKLDANKEMLGVRFTLVNYSRGSGRLSLFMEEPEAQPLARRDFFRTVYRLIGKTPGVTYSVRRHSGGDFDKKLTVRLFGADSGRLTELAGRVRERLANLPGLGELDFEEDTPPHELAVVVDRDLGEKHGVTAREVARRVAGTLRGTRRLPRFQQGEQELEMVVRQDDVAEGFAALHAMRFPGDSGQVAFDAVARYRFQGTPAVYHREDGKVALTLEAEVNSGDFSDLTQRVRQELDAFPLPDGYRWSFGRESRQVAEDRQSLSVVLGLALVAILIVMGVLFESFVLPLTVLVTIPLALFGSAWLLFLTETALDTTGMIGMVILSGVVVNNGIVLVDRINRERNEGAALTEAIVAAGEVRLRPILMTALTTVFGLLPMVLGYTNVAGFSFVSLGRVVSGGLLAATVLTLLVVPLTYYGLVRLGEVLGGRRGEGRGVESVQVGG